MHFLSLLLLVFYALQCAQKMHEVKRAISLNAFAKKNARNEKEEKKQRKKIRKNGMQFFCIMKNAAGKHTHTRAEKCIA